MNIYMGEILSELRYDSGANPEQSRSIGEASRNPGSSDLQTQLLSLGASPSRGMGNAKFEM
jgi:hypothetical protein